jgi:hypothetical protein
MVCPEVLWMIERMGDSHGSLLWTFKGGSLAVRRNLTAAAAIQGGQPIRREPRNDSDGASSGMDLPTPVGNPGPARRRAGIPTATHSHGDEVLC